MAKIAVELDRAIECRKKNGDAVALTSLVLADGKGWRVTDLLCTSGPRDKAFEEQHQDVSIAMVLAGSFQYRSAGGCGFMTPGSLLLGNPGQFFECGHEHGMGDRCISFQFDPGHFENLAAESGLDSRFAAPRIAPLRELSSLVSRACANLYASKDTERSNTWEELSLQVAETAARLSRNSKKPISFPPSAIARVTRVVRRIEREGHSNLTLRDMAREARLSRFHFLRIFEQLTGLTPHQYLLRARLREAAARLVGTSDKILDVAYDCGFGDVSNFNRNFRAEFKVSPRAFRSA